MGNRVIWDFLKEETAAKAARVPLGQLASRRRNKPEQCSRDIFVVRYRRSFLRRAPFDQAELLPPPQKATIQIKRRPFSRAHSAREALPDSSPTSRVSA